MKRAWPAYSAACRQDVDRLLRKGGSLSAYRANPDFLVGPARGSWAWKLERLAEKQFQIPHAVACNSGTMALWVALMAANLSPKGEIITTAFTFSATPAAIRWAGYEPVFADVLDTGCMDPQSAQRMVSSRTVAVMPVDLFGQLCDYAQLKRLGLPIIEDSCQAVGAKRDGTWAGGFGLAGAYSFNGAKNVPAGEAGMLVTRDAAVARRARLMISHGENFGEGSIGLNGRLNELTACVAWHGMKSVLAQNAARRRRVAEILAQKVGLDHACYVYGWTGWDRARIAKKLRQQGCQISEGYIQPPLHQYPAFKDCRRDGILPTTTRLSSESLLLLLSAPVDTL